jgi:beta-mannosidase
VRLPEPPARSIPARIRVESHEDLPLDVNWEVACCPPEAYLDPRTLDRLDWLPTRVPGTAAGALGDAGLWRAGETRDFDSEDWWFRTRFRAAPPESGEEALLRFDGIATIAEVFLNGEKLLENESMFAAHTLDVGALLATDNELAIRCRALGPLLAQRRKPRARWRTRLVDGNLRFFRTMLLGRAPGFAPSPAAVGPWRPVRLIRRRALAVDEFELRARVTDETQAAGLLSIRARLRSLDGRGIERAELELRGPSGTHRSAVAIDAEDTGDDTTLVEDTLRLPGIVRWWPHTHGEPALYDARLLIETNSATVIVDCGRIGFRTLSAGSEPNHDMEADGLNLHVNGLPIFVRGAVWTPVDPVGLAPDRATLHAALGRVRDAGMNMLRIPGTGAYESSEFHDICDELGLLVWQDFMFANLDYPIEDERFRASVEREARAQLEELTPHPSLAVLCGNSEIEQQVAMLGLDPSLGRGKLFGEILPSLVSEARSDAIYLPSTPCGGTLPFRPDRGIAHYYGVGGYRRPLEDARRAEVRFAAECLAFSNVPDEAGVDAVLPESPAQVAVHHPRWKAGVPRDTGNGWDFEDVRDHYLQRLFGLDPSELRRVDQERYLELSRAVTGEAMAEVFGEWRRLGSPCAGGLVLWLTDLVPGAGWGVIDHSGKPKPAYHHLRRVLAPTAIWLSDEGLGGMRVHVAHDRPTPLPAALRIALYRDGHRLVEQGAETLELSAHDTLERDVEALLGRFADVSWAYRFGPPGHDVVVATLQRGDGESVEILSQAFRFPAGRPLQMWSAEELGLRGTIRLGGDTTTLRLESRRLAYGVRIHMPGFSPADDALTLEPEMPREIALVRMQGHEPDAPAGGTLTALNLNGRIALGLDSGEQAS